MMKTKRYVMLNIFTIILLMSCKQNIEIVERLKTTDYKLFFGVTIESRKLEEKNYVAYKFTKEKNGEKFTLPNYKYFSDKETTDSSLFDIFKYGKAIGVKTFSESNIAAKHYADSIFAEFEKMRVPKIFSSDKQGYFIVFFLNKVDFIMYVPDKDKIYSDFWREKLQRAEEIELNWYSGKY